jgi:hypothetical protein
VSKCRHKSTRHRYWRDGAWCGVVYGVNAAEWISANDGSVVCQDCGAWLSLGPATHDRYAVDDEILAAELALDPAYADRLKGPRPHCLVGGRPICESGGGCDGCDIWDLARAIFDHQEPTMTDAAQMAKRRKR